MQMMDQETTQRRMTSPVTDSVSESELTQRCLF